ncbi:MAG: transposase zinc-binding domain-containing protein [Mariniphaga sp.]|nr:transposase zinc-binding domain-containing protein [Mariniphaga sp.]
METPINKRQKAEVAGVFNACIGQAGAKYNLCHVQQKAFDDIVACRTSLLGGHINSCTGCGFKRQTYNSCHNRHCPKCQFLKQEQWVDKLKGRLIPGRYFHIVFSVPHLLNQLFYINQSICYKLLFDAASQALQNAGRNPGFLGAETGAVAVGANTLLPSPGPHAGPGGWALRGRDRMGERTQKVFCACKSPFQNVQGGIYQVIEKSVG